MKQSLLAFLAMAVFTLLALSQQRVTMHYHGLVYGREYEIAAMNKVMDMLTLIQTEAFDEADVASSVDPAQRTTTTDLSTTLGLEVDETDFDDIDDYNGYSDTSSVYKFNGYPYAFDTFIEVCYIDEVNPAGATESDRCVSSPTLAKQVTIIIKESEPESPTTLLPEQEDKNPRQRSPVFVKISRVYSPAALAYH